jgi:hypothetical protein
MPHPDFSQTPLEYGQHRVLAPAKLTFLSRGVWLEIIPGTLADSPEGPSITSRGHKKLNTSMDDLVNLWHAERAAADLKGDQRPVVAIANFREYKDGRKVNGAYIHRGIEGEDYFVKNDRHPRAPGSKCHLTHVMLRRAPQPWPA